MIFTSPIFFQNLTNYHFVIMICGGNLFLVLVIRQVVVILKTPVKVFKGST